MFAVVLTFLFAICSATESAVQADQQSTGCSLCQLIMQYVETYVSQNQTEQEIIQKLEAFCANIPLFGPECDSIVSSYLPSMIQWIINKEPPPVFCATVRVCGAPRLPEKKTTSSTGCSLCQMAVTYVEKWISEQSTEQQIAKKLESFCTIVGPLSPECQSFVAVYAPQLINWIVSKENPDTFCTQVGLCQSEQQHLHHINTNHQNKDFFTYKGKLPKFEKREEEDNEEEDEDDDLFEEEQSAGCQVCQLIVTYVEQLVANNNTVNQIVAKVEDLCGLLGPNLSPICDQIAVKYVPSLVQWIIKKENPQAFCAQVHLC